MVDLDDVCKLILTSVLNGSEEYAAIARDINAGSYKTVKNHIADDLVPKKLVKIAKKRRGIRTYDIIQLTEEGLAAAREIKGT